MYRFPYDNEDNDDHDDEHDDDDDDDDDDDEVLTENVRIELLGKPRSGHDPTSRREPMPLHSSTLHTALKLHCSTCAAG